MSHRARDIQPCWRCGAKVDMVFDWRGRPIALELRLDASRPPSFFEPEMGEFREVHRHVCLPKAPPAPNDGRELLRPIERRRPKPQLEMFG